MGSPDVVDLNQSASPDTANQVEAGGRRGPVYPFPSPGLCSRSLLQGRRRLPCKTHHVVSFFLFFAMVCATRRRGVRVRFAVIVSLKTVAET